MNDIMKPNFTPQTLEEAQNFAAMIAKSHMIPNDYKGKPGDVLAAVIMGAELGLAPLQAMQSIAVVNGKPSIYGDAALGLVRASGQLEEFKEWVDGDDDKAVAHCQVKRRGEDRTVKTFSVEDAKRAGLWGRNTWKSYPQRMLAMRARGFALRDTFADVLKGLYIREEAQDIPTPKDVAVEVITGAAESRSDQVLHTLQHKHPEQAEFEAPPIVDTETGELDMDAQQPIVKLAEVTNAINEAANLDELKQVGGLAKQLPDDDQEIARKAYKFREQQLKGKAA